MDPARKMESQKDAKKIQELHKMTLENKLSEEVKHEILTEVERERRKEIVTELYKECMNSDNFFIRTNTIKFLWMLADDINPEKFEKLRSTVSDNYDYLPEYTGGEFYNEKLFGIEDFSHLSPEKDEEEYERGVRAAFGSGFINLLESNIIGNYFTNPKDYEKIIDWDMDDNSSFPYKDVACKLIGGLSKVNPKKFEELIEKEINYSGKIRGSQMIEHLYLLPEINLEKYLEIYKDKITDEKYPVQEYVAESIKGLINVNLNIYMDLYNQGINSADKGIQSSTIKTLDELSKVSGKKYIKLVEDGIKHEQEEVRKNTFKHIEILAEINSKKYEQFIELGLKDESNYVNLATISSMKSLAEINPEKYITLCKKLIYFNTRDKIHAALEHLTTIATIDKDEYLKIFNFMQKRVNENYEPILMESIKGLSKTDPEKYIELLNEKLNYSEGKNNNSLDVNVSLMQALIPLSSIDKDEYRSIIEKGYKYNDEYAIFNSIGSLIQTNPEEYLYQFKRAQKFIKKFQKDNEHNDYEEYQKEIVNFLTSSIPEFVSTIKEKELTFIEDEHFEFSKTYLESKFIKNKQGKLLSSKKIIKDLNKIRKEVADIKNIQEVLNNNEVESLDELIKCGKLDLKNDFTVVSVLGGGLNGTTYKLKAKYFDNAYMALKIPKDNKTPEEKEKESMIWGRLLGKDPINVVQVHNAGENMVEVDGKPVYSILMSYVEGSTLKDYLDKKEKLTESEVIQYGADLCNGLLEIRTADDKGKEIYYRDLHLENIMIDKKTSRAKITDLGEATFDPKTIHNQNRSYGGNNDLVSLGQIMYKMATGENLFNETNKQDDEVKDQIKVTREKAYKSKVTLKHYLNKVKQGVEGPLGDIIVDLLDDELLKQPSLKKLEEVQDELSAQYIACLKYSNS